jgi:hypothetical protein
MGKINNLFSFVMYPTQPSLRLRQAQPDREGVEMYKLKKLQFCLLKSASPGC